MSTDHVLRQGEHLSQIADKYGYSDYKAIWNHPNNARLKKLRDNPSVQEVDEIFFAHVVQEFQCDLGLPVTGVCDAATQSKLTSLHGS